MRRLVPLVFVMACSSSAENTGSPTDAGTGDTPVVDTGVEVAPPVDVGTDAGTGIQFSLCPAAYTGACATLDAPLDHDAPTGKTIKLMVNRIATKPGATGQIWVLEGGPGGSVSDLNDLALSLAKALPGYDVYGLEHRGVGMSQYLGCKGEPVDPSLAAFDAFWGPCAEELGKGDAKYFTTTQAAKDLGWAIDRVKPKGQKLFVYGVSYGTYWVQRYLQVRGEQPDGVILDSLVAPGVQYLSAWAGQMDASAKKLAEACKADTTCKTALGTDPWAQVQALAAKVTAGTCTAAGDPQRVFTAVETLLQVNQLHGLAFAALYRYGRCTTKDAAAVKMLADRFGGDTPGPLFSHALYFNVMFSELWETPAPTAATFHVRDVAVSFPTFLEYYAPLEAKWPKYTPDAFVGKWPTTDKPVLMLAGGYDAQTPLPLASEAKKHFTGANQLFVEIPNGNHGLINQSLVTADAPNCGEQIISSWVLSGGTKADTSCVASVAPPTFTFDSALTKALMGVDFAFDDTPPAAPPVKAPKWTPADLERALRIARRWR